MLSQDTDRSQAIHIRHISHRWLRWLDGKMAAMQAENGGYFDLSAIFRGKDCPYETGVHGKYRTTQKLGQDV